MEFRKLGLSDLGVSTIALGCWAFAGGRFWDEQSDVDSINTVHAALDLGVNFFDNAEAYGDGHSEAILGRALVGRRDKAIIATKVSQENLDTEGVRKACHDSLRRLQTDYIDLYQIHWPSRTVKLSETMEALKVLRQEGKIRAIGVSNFGVEDLNELLSIGWIEANQLPYNLLWRAIEYDIREKCVDAGVSILCYSPLMQALLTGKYNSADDVPDGRARSRHFATERPLARHGETGFEQETFATIEKIRDLCAQIDQPMANVSIAWLLNQPGVTAVVLGARTPKQIKRNLRAVEISLSQDVITALNEITDPLKQKLGVNPDLWQSESRFQ